MRLPVVASLVALAFTQAAVAQEGGGGTRLLRSPTVSRDLIAFAYAGDLWVVSGSGGAAPLLTAQNQTSQWRHYRGGRAHPIRLMNLADYAVEKLPWTDSNDTDPMWVGDTVYFLSDRNRTVNLFSYAVDTKAVRQLTQHDDYDIMSASAGPDAIVYEQAGYIHLFDLKTGQARRLSIDVNGDFPWARPQFKKVATMIRDAALSPTGVRAAFEARGEIFTVPVDKGDYRNLTQSPGVHDRSPVWS